jgi:hypothetical protein
MKKILAAFVLLPLVSCKAPHAPRGGLWSALPIAYNMPLQGTFVSGYDDHAGYVHITGAAVEVMIVEFLGENESHELLQQDQKHYALELSRGVIERQPAPDQFAVRITQSTCLGLSGYTVVLSYDNRQLSLEESGMMLAPRFDKDLFHHMEKFDSNLLIINETSTLPNTLWGCFGREGDGFSFTETRE